MAAMFILQVGLTLTVWFRVNNCYHAIKERKELKNDKNKQSTKAWKDIS